MPLLLAIGVSVHAEAADQPSFHQGAAVGVGVLQLDNVGPWLDARYLLQWGHSTSTYLRLEPGLAYTWNSWWNPVQISGSGRLCHDLAQGCSSSAGHAERPDESNHRMGYLVRVLREFFGGSNPAATQLFERAHGLIVEVWLDTAELLERAADLAESADLLGHDAINRRTALLGLELCARDRHYHAAPDQIVAETERLARAQPRKRALIRIPERARTLLERLTLASWVATLSTGCGGQTDGDSPLRQEGGLGLGEGGAGDSGGSGAFSEGAVIVGETSDETDNAIQASIVSV